MRKIDYTLLAQLVKIETQKGGIAAETAERIARNFAQRAHVEKGSFLLACGLKL